MIVGTQDGVEWRQGYLGTREFQCLGCKAWFRASPGMIEAGICRSCEHDGVTVPGLRQRKLALLSERILALTNEDWALIFYDRPELRQRLRNALEL